jgi:hypothetical protein
MSDTRTLHRRRPAAHLHQPTTPATPTAPTYAPISPAHPISPADPIDAISPADAINPADPIAPVDAEAALLDSYADLVRLAYAILPAKLSRHRRVLAAHAVVQRALPDQRQLERHLIDATDLKGAIDAKAYVRDRVRQASIEQAEARTPLRRKPQAWAFQLVSLTDPTEADFDPCSLRPARRADLARRNTRAGNLVIVVTTLLALGILASLVTNR